MTRNRMVRLLASAVLLASLWSGLAGAKEPEPAAPPPGDPRAAFRTGADLMGKGAFGEAIPFLKQAEAAFPENPNVLWNLGIASAEVANHSEALRYWQRYRTAVPDDWRALAKIIQAYQTLGDIAARDREIRALYALRASHPDLKKAERFCREQLMAAGKKILVFEYFEPRGERRMYYRFSITDATGVEASFFSLGSYDGTTEVLRELGELSKKGRVYHLDRYDQAAHKTYGFFDEQPAYDTVRKMVLDALEGRSPQAPRRKTR